MNRPMTSRERVLATLDGGPTDYVPLCFEGLCHGVLPMLAERLPDPLERATHYLERGIDTALLLDVPPCSGRGFTASEVTFSAPGEPYPMGRRVYSTARGTLEQVVSRTADYPTHMKLWSDHNVPRGRSRRFLVESATDLDILELILQPPTDDELVAFRERATAWRAFADRHGLLVSGSLAGVGDPLLWMSGVEIPVMAGLLDPAFLDRYIEIVARLDQARLERYLEVGVDLVVRRGWYESTDFWSPALYRRYLLGPLRRQVQTAREAGVRFCYVMNSGSVPLFDSFNDAGFDIYSNFDSLSVKADLETIGRTLAPTMALCGGVNNQHVLERGTESEVRSAVRRALETLAPRGRFLLAPGDSVLATDAAARANVETMIDEWTLTRATRYTS